MNNILKISASVILSFANKRTDAQEKLLMKNTHTGKKYSFTFRNNVNFELKNDTILYNNWKIEHCTDSTMFVSNWKYKTGECGNGDETARSIKEVKFSDLKYIRFVNPASPKLFPGILMFGSGLALAASPALAQDSSNHFNQNNFKNIVMVSAAVFTISGIVEYELCKKDINYDMREWKISRKKKIFP